MRLWQNDPTETPIRWFFAEHNAKTISELTQFVSTNWDDNYPNRPVGETKSNVRTYDKGSNPIGYAGIEPCGPPDAIANGGIHGATPEIQTNVDGSCDCCTLANQVSAFGLGSGFDSLYPVVNRRPIGLGVGQIGTQEGRLVHTGPIGLGTGEIGSQGINHIQDNAFGCGTGESGSQGINHIQDNAFGCGTGESGSQGSGFTQDGLVGCGTNEIGYQEGIVSAIGDYKWSFSNASQVGWLECDGSTPLIATYPTLAALLGTTFGGNGTTTFGLPSPEGRVLIGSGSGSGLTPRSVGDVGGVEEVTLEDSQSGLPVHQHWANPAAGTVNLINASASVGLYGLVAGGGDLLAASAAGPADASDPHTNMQPWVCVGHLFIFSGV